jgi:flagellar basal body-associated protein FliL
MKKNILTIVVLVLQIISIILSSVIIFVMIPTVNKTSNLMDKVMQNIDLVDNTSTKKEEKGISVSDITVHKVADQIKVNLKPSDDAIHYAALNVSLSVNNNNKETKNLEPKIDENEYQIQDIISRAFSKYTINQVSGNVDKIKEQVLKDIQDYFQSDFIVNVSFGNLVMQ